MMVALLYALFKDVMLRVIALDGFFPELMELAQQIAEIRL